MQEFFFTILAIWVIWRLFGAFTEGRKTTQSYQTHYHYYARKEQASQQRSQTKEGDVRIETKQQNSSRIPPSEGEYVDYEEV